MRRPLALRAEIVQHLRKAGAEELAPHAVGVHARGQRIVGRHQPVRQIQPGRRGRRCRACRGSRGSRAARCRRFRPAIAARAECASRPALTASETITRGMAVSSSAAASSSLRDLGHFGLRFRRWPTGNARPLPPSVPSVRLSSATRSARSTASGISLPFSAVGHAYSLGESAMRKRPDGGAAHFRILPDAHGQHGVGGGFQRLRKSQRQHTLVVSLYALTAQPVFGSPSMAPRRQILRSPGCSHWPCR